MKLFVKTLFVLALGLSATAEAGHWQMYNQTTTYVNNAVYCEDITLGGAPWIQYETYVAPLYTMYAYPKHLEEVDEDIKHVTDRACLSSPLRVRKIDSWYVWIP